MSVQYKSKDYKVVGKDLPVLDAVEKVSGTLKNGVDFNVPNQVYGKIIRSTLPHARVIHIDSSKAEALPGVLGVVSHIDSSDHNWDGVWDNYRGKVLDGVARFVGDEIGAIAATTQEIAEQALELIEVEYEELPAVLDIKEALKASAPQLREEGNVRDQYQVKWGDNDKGAEEADHIVELEMEFKAQNFAGIGRNACVCEWEGEKVTMWTSTQTPSELQSGIHQAFGIPMSSVRVIALPSGASMGLWWSNNFMMVTALLAKKVKMPVKIELTAQECMATVKRRHVEITSGRMGVKKDGTLTVTDFYHLMDNGGYGFKTDVYFFNCDLWGGATNGDYRVVGVNTNLVTSGCMRAVGDITMGLCVERMADMCAELVDMDPVDFRIKNQMKEGDELRMQESREHIVGSAKDYVAGLTEEQKEGWPKMFHNASGSTDQLLKQGAEKFDWKNRFKGWGVPTAVNGSKHRGVGVGTGAHCCGVEFGGNASATVRVNHDGSLNIFASCGRQGQGSETTLSQVACEELGIELEKSSIINGDTTAMPWSSGSSASTTMFRTGWAVREAAKDAKRQILEIASKEFFEGTSVDSLGIQNGIISVLDDHADTRHISIEDLLGTLRSDSLGQTTVINGRTEAVMPPTIAFSRQWAAQFAEVEVDVETGEIKIIDFLAGQDSGTVMNPKVLKNQVIGGAICGAGFALYEGIEFDKKDGRVLNDGFLDYKLLRTGDFPPNSEVFFVESPDPVGPFGARGAGESPAAASAPALCQAVYNAIGVWVDVPMTPEAVVTALKKKRESS
ncbi:MAG: xanthine dehydrogenase family protein molybdopterin-binding subunit [Halopseudomonas sp.]